MCFEKELERLYKKRGRRELFRPVNPRSRRRRNGKLATNLD
jgi:hypothetical protein